MRDYTAAITHLKQTDPRLASLIDWIGPCQLDQQLQTGDLLACLIRAIIFQQLSGKAASTIHQRFLQLYLPQASPNAQDILETPDERLRSAGISRSKIAYLKDLASHITQGLPSLEQLETMDDETIIHTLLPIKGIGRWTVQMLLIFRLHRWDVLPVDDLGLRSGIRLVYGLPDLPDRRTAEKLGEVWQPYRTIATWYFWRSLDRRQEWHQI